LASLTTQTDKLGIFVLKVCYTLLSMNTKLIIGVVAIGAGIFILATFIKPGSETEGGTPEGGTVTEVTAVTMPNGLPNNVPMYPDAELSAVQDLDQEGERNVTLTLIASATVADVNTWYRGALKENGWAVTDDKMVGGYVLLKGENGDITTFTQVANAEELGKAKITQRIRIR
jgi:hypothetical protein